MLTTPKRSSRAQAKRDVDKSSPFVPADYTIEDVYALQALAGGAATPEQQARAILWIVWAVARTGDLECRATERDSTFAGGKRFIGLQILKLVNMPVEEITARFSKDADPAHPENMKDTP